MSEFCRSGPTSNVPPEARKLALGKAESQVLEEPVLTVVIPAYNEARTIDEVLRRVIASPYSKQIIVVDDYSSDGTAEILLGWQKHPQLVLLRHSKNRGKGAAIRTGLQYAAGRFTIIQDADLEYDPEDYSRVIEPLLSGEADAVYGSRYLRTVGQPPPWRLLRCGVSVLNACVCLLYGVRLTDEATCYKAFPTSVLRKMDLQCERFEFCPEVTAKACRLRLTILEVPVHYHARTIRQGKKLRWRDGVEAIVTLWKWRHWTPTIPSQVIPRFAAKHGDQCRDVLLEQVNDGAISQR